MLQWLQSILAVVILFTLGCSIYYSVKYRRQHSRKHRGVYAAKMNISMGVMLLAISLVQFLLFTGSTLRVIVGAVFLLLGLFNLFAGIRNYGLFSRVKE